MEFINEKRGTVVDVSKDRTEITILLQKGGQVITRNAGFEIGDKVCFLLDAAKLRIIRVMSALTADVAVVVGSDPIMQAALIEEPHDLEDEEEEEAITREDKNGFNREISRDPDEEQAGVEFDISDGSESQRLE